jgi:acid phosphatase class B
MAKQGQGGEDSLKWTIEGLCAEMQQKVAASHARRGNQVVLMTGRKVATEEQAGLEACGVTVMPTR